METQKNFIVYRSSAGSGKTFTLVKEYLKIVLNDKNKVRSVLAITFTNAAAAEMKTRIIETLGKLSKLNVNDIQNWPEDVKSILAHICSESEFNFSSSEKYQIIILSASEVLSLIIHNYGDFAVSTIDSFTHRVIRTFAFDLQIPLNFDIEMDDKTLLSQAVDILVSRVGTDDNGSFTKLMIAYMERTTDDEKSLSIEKSIIKLAKNILKEDPDNNISRLKEISLEEFFRIQKNIVALINAFEQEIAKIAQDVVREIDVRNIPDEAFFRGKTGISTYFRNLAGGKIFEKIEPNSYVKETIADNKWFSGKCTPSDKDVISEVSGIISDAYSVIMNKAEESFGQYIMLKLLNKNIFPLAVLNEVEKVLEEIKSSNAVLHISDFNKRIAEIVSQQPVPFIYERLGEKYQHYMIDEFQDTSLLQWQNLLPLVENALANGNMNLVVGDCKQAIYRWRGGEVEQFAILPNLLPKIKSVSKPHWEKALNSYFELKPLNTNYRSHEEVVGFNNSFFNYIQSNVLKGEYAKIYEGCEQKFQEKKTGGFVHLEFIPSESDDEEDKGFVDYTLDKTLEIVLELRDVYKHPLSDITILCRSNSNANLVARFLLENNIPVISQESLLLNFSREVNFFVSFLKLLSRPYDRISFVEVVNYITQSGIIKNSASIHISLCKINEFPLNREQNYNGHILKLESLLKENGYDISFSKMKNLNLWDVCEVIVRSFFSDKEGVDPFVAFFMDAVFDYTDKNPSSIEDFLQWWHEKGGELSVVVPKGIDAVQIMTIHKAKGLQFPVVLFPFANMNISKAGLEGFWHNIEIDSLPELPLGFFNFTKDLEKTTLADDYLMEKQKTFLDLLNIVYVGFTRPQKKLFVLTNYPKNEKFTEQGTTVAYHLRNFLEYKEMWADGVLSYGFGTNESEPERQGQTNTDANNNVSFDKYLSSDWRNKIYIRPVLKTPDINDEKLKAMIRGRLIHKVMENVYDRMDVDKVLSSMIVNGEIVAEEKPVLTEKIYKFVNSKELYDYYNGDSKILNEADIMNENGHFFRPDRVVLSGDNAAVIDYKTGSRSELYKKQLLQYKALIEQMGYKNVDAFLVYLDEEIIEKI
ncbi:MAG: UvrD-helicase domain-containing protein [Bacteroidetes bacterium]|nr:UvrD-helicase domain-containing protein [Bacteroidota bacterium]